MSGSPAAQTVRLLPVLLLALHPALPLALVLPRGLRDAQIVPELAPRPEDSVVTKHTTSPFNTTDIEVYLRRFGINTLILTGYSTTGVVEGSLRDARDKDYDCIVVRDCCAAATEQEHNTCMDIVFPRMAWVASVDEVIDAIK
jgi:nicotinamidase-related amidase